MPRIAFIGEENKNWEKKNKVIIYDQHVQRYTLYIGEYMNIHRKI